MQPIKTLDNYFRDWEAYVFGFGYGTGEPHIIPCLHKFLDLCRKPGLGLAYDFMELEQELGGPTTWLLINILCRHNVVEYGTSPRHGWLTAEGQRLRAYVCDRDPELLVEMSCNGPGLDEGYAHCRPDTCNCGPDGYENGRVCPNPFW